MTKRGRACLGLLALLVVAGPTQAHGSAPAREIDARVLFDDDGLVAYGGCPAELASSGACQPLATGLDLLVLDVREAYLGDAPALVLRMVWQTDAPAAGQGLRLHLEAAGAAHDLEATTADGMAFSTMDFDRLDGPTDAFDGHPKALDGWVTLSRLGLAVGDEVTGITLHSTMAGEPDDLMPGGWMLQGQEVQHIPEEPDPGHVAPAAPGTYIVRGPAPLVTATPSAGIVDLARPGNLTVRLSNPLSSLTQTVSLDTSLGPGVLATVDRGELTLDPGATREVSLIVDPASRSGNLTLVATTDLGGRATSAFIVVAPAANTTATTTSTNAAGKDAPGLGWLPLGLAALAAAGVRRK